MKGKKIVKINEDLPEKFGSWIFLIWRSGRAIRSQSEEEEIKIEVFFLQTRQHLAYKYSMQVT